MPGIEDVAHEGLPEGTHRGLRVSHTERGSRASTIATRRTKECPKTKVERNKVSITCGSGDLPCLWTADAHLRRYWVGELTRCRPSERSSRGVVG
jgi:hypothetical protein